MQMMRAMALVIVAVLTVAQAAGGKAALAAEGKGDRGARAAQRDRDDRRDDEDRRERDDGRERADRREGAERRARTDGSAARRSESARPVSRPGSHFSDEHRAFVHEYYETEFRGGRCPPGLARKYNGCMPPGQARKWVVGRPLPRDVIYHDVPAQLVVRFGRPPAGHRYVRVASDILLIAIGTGMVVDALRDLGR